MNEREKEILENIAKAFPYMSEFDKGYFLGIAKASANAKVALKKYDLSGEIIKAELAATG